MRFILIAATFVLGHLSAPATYAQEYPNKPIRVIVPADVGLGTDVAARLFANRLQTVLKQPIIIENRSGGGGEIGTVEAVRATPDGYTLFHSNSSVLAGNKWIYPRTFDSDKDLVPIVAVSTTPVVLLSGPQLRGKALKEVITIAKEAAKPLFLGSAATVNSVVYGMLREAAGIELLLVRYRSNQQAYVDLINGNIQLMIDGVPPATPFIKAGKVTGIAVTAPKRTEFLPDLPTFQESGFNIALFSWSGLLGPKGISPEILQTLNRAGNEALNDPEIRNRMKSLGSNALGGTPEEFGRLMRNDGETWGRMIKRFDLK